jgi:Ras-related C3 botulinum toxin substrate 1
MQLSLTGTQLPKDVLLYLLSFVAPPQLLVVAQVSRKMNAAASSDIVWRRAAAELSRWFDGPVAWLDATGSSTKQATVKGQCRARVLHRLVKREPEQRDRAPLLRIVLVGDCGAGKASMLFRFMSELYPEDVGCIFLFVTFFVPHVSQYIPAVFVDKYASSVSFGRTALSVELWQTADLDNLAQIRSSTDVVALCFSVASPASFSDIRAKWYYEVARGSPMPGTRDPAVETIVLLVGTKTDLRDDAATIAELAAEKLAPVTCEQGIALAQELGLAGYAETSARTGSGVSALVRACCAIFCQREDASCDN